MKLSTAFKRVLLTTLLVLLLSGLMAWILDHWFQVDQGLGPQPPSARIWFVRIHGIFGLWFLSVFGFLFHSHVLRGWRAKKRLKSGLALLIPLVVMCLTVPGLYYITDDGIKDVVEQVHTYLGMALTIPFLIHWIGSNNR